MNELISATRVAAWVAYLAGALLTLLWKFVVEVRGDMNKNSWSIGKAVSNWFFEDSNDNRVSWFVTVGIVWTLGAIFIDLRGKGGVFSFVDTVPMHNAIAFFLGGTMEMIAPAATKQFMRWILSKLPGGGG